MRWLEIVVNAPQGEQNYLVRDFGIIQNGLYKIVGSMPQQSIQDDRFKLEQQFQAYGTHEIILGNRLVAQILRETRRNEKFDYVLIPGLIKSVFDPAKEQYVQLSLPFSSDKE